jgi:hypothetical protein
MKYEDYIKIEDGMIYSNVTLRLYSYLLTQGNKKIKNAGIKITFYTNSTPYSIRRMVDEDLEDIMKMEEKTKNMFGMFAMFV